MRDVADICPVEKIGVVSDLPVRLATLPDIVEASSTLPVPRAKFV